MVEHIDLVENDIKGIDKNILIDTYYIGYEFCQMANNFNKEDKRYYVCMYLYVLFSISGNYDEKSLEIISVNDDNYKLIFKNISNSIIKLKIADIFWYLYKQKIFKTKHINVYMQFIKNNCTDYLLYLDDNEKFIFFYVMIEKLIIILKEMNVKDVLHSLQLKILEKYEKLEISDYRNSLYTKFFRGIDEDIIIKYMKNYHNLFSML